ncbi:MAG: hypothetical protein P8L77_03855 [Gammaproteobacteria bacterium]|nr:hypothetical protein [Gammaproteobacteria bacterium]
MTNISLWISDKNLRGLRDAIEQVLETEIQQFNKAPLIDGGPTNDEQFRNNICYLMHTLKHIDSLGDRPDTSKPPGILTIMFCCCLLALLIAFAISLVYEQLNYKRLKGNIPVEKKIYNSLPDDFKNLFQESPLHNGFFSCRKKAPLALFS